MFFQGHATFFSSSFYRVGRRVSSVILMFNSVSIRESLTLKNDTFNDASSVFEGKLELISMFPVSLFSQDYFLKFSQEHYRKVVTRKLTFPNK